SLSLSQHSSPSQSDQEQNIVQKLSTAVNDSILPQQFARVKLYNHREPVKNVQRNTKDMHFLGGESPRQPKAEQFLRAVPPLRQECVLLGAEPKPQLRPCFSPLIGAEVHGTVDGAFDSGYLMTANVNGQILRGVLFTPGPAVASPRPAINSQGLTCATAIFQHSPSPHAIPVHVRPPRQPISGVLPECGHHLKQSPQVQVVKAQPVKFKGDMQDVVLTLGGPGGGGLS
ncbi:hypothetical protein BHM03_00061536, partial [Ensete ventricosum]